ncbi:MAG: diguanylate cyclase domain-containing protein, partial [Oscillospiraceae bacterium]
MSKNNNADSKNFTKRIITNFLVIVVVLLILFGIFSYLLTRINVSSNSVQTMNNTGSLVSGLLDDHVKLFAEQLDVITSNPDLKDFIINTNAEAVKDIMSAEKIPGYKAITDSLDAISGHNNDIVSAWVISEQNGILIGNGNVMLTSEDYNLSEREWYKKYISGGMSSYKYICTPASPSIFNPDENVITVIVPAEADGNVYAFCGLEIKASSIFSVLSKYTFNTGSYPIITYNSSIIYSPSDSDFLNKFSLTEQPILNIISQNTVASGNIDHYVSEKSGTVYYYIETSKITGWNVIVLFNSSEINGNVYTTFIQQIAILICLCALMIVWGINILKRETNSINDILKCTEELAVGNLNYRIQKIDRTEIGKISENINHIAGTIQAKNAIINNFNTTDTLTGLSNRLKLYEYMDDIIRTREEGRSRFAVMFIDIDNFKWLNETLGHNFGDAVLSAFASELKELIAHNSVFRFSGDEFIIIHEFDEDYSSVYSVIEKLHNCFNKPLEILNDKIYVKFSIGVSIYPDDDLTPDLLLRDAEMALHRAKDSGKDRVAFYTNSHNSKSVYSKAAIARSLNEALQNGELFLHYQPIVSTKTCDIHGFEVLLRWISPEFGVVPPAEFINVAEESGAIVQI